MAHFSFGGGDPADVNEERLSDTHYITEEKPSDFIFRNQQVLEGRWATIARRRWAKPKSINLVEEGKEEPASINQIQGEWELLPCTLDSGAIDWVTPKTTATRCLIKESRLSKAGMGYKAPNGTSVKNDGQKP